MYIQETLSNSYHLLQVFKKETSDIKGQVRKLNTVALLAGLKSWNHLQELVRSPSIISYDKLIIKTLAVEKSYTLFPTINCLFEPLTDKLLDQMDTINADQDLRVICLYCYVAQAGIFKDSQRIFEKCYWYDDPQPSFMVRFDLRHHEKSHLYKQINAVLEDNLDEHKERGLIYDDVKTVWTYFRDAITYDQDVFRNPDKIVPLLKDFAKVYKEECFNTLTGGEFEDYKHLTLQFFTTTDGDIFDFTNGGIQVSIIPTDDSSICLHKITPSLGNIKVDTGTQDEIKNWFLENGFHSELKLEHVRMSIQQKKEDDQKLAEFSDKVERGITQ